MFQTLLANAAEGVDATVFIDDPPLPKTGPEMGYRGKIKLIMTKEIPSAEKSYGRLFHWFTLCHTNLRGLITLVGTFSNGNWFRWTWTSM